MLSSFVDPLLWLGQQERSVLPLVGRENEMQLIHTLLNTVLHDETVGTRALTIRGEMGVGKSRLLAEIYTQAQTVGFRVIEGRAYESGNLFPYFPFVEALRPVLRTLSAEKLRHHLGLSSQQKTAKQEQPSTTHGDAYEAKDEIISFVGTPLIAALAHLFPTLPTLLDVTITAEQLSPEQEKFRLFDAVATLLERMALDQPILLGIDNLQWADSASLELTMYLTMRLHQSRVAMIGVTRFPGGPNQWSSTDRPTTTVTMVKMLGELVRQRLLMILPLAPLDTSAATQHLQHLLPGKRDEHLEQILLTRAGGNPFFLEELVRALTRSHAIIQQGDTWLPTRSIETELPDDILLAVKQRLQELSQACLDMLRAASLFGQTFPMDALLRVTNQAAQRDSSPSVEAQFTVCPLGIAPTLPQNSTLLIDEAVQAGIITLIPDAPRENKDVLFDPIELASPSPIYTFCQGIVQEVLRTEIPSHRLPELPGYAGDFYIPFLAEGYLHLEIYDKATTYVERIRTLRGFMYYGYSVDRILGIVAAQAENWPLAEQAFEDGLALCRRANNQPEEATILYEQARVILMQSRTQPQPIQEQTLQRIQHLCDQAQQIFLQYGMQRYVDLVETVQSGVDLLNKQSRGEIIPKVSVSPPEQERDELLAPGYHLDLSLTARELEVLRLVAEGHTDREVADALVISPRTVNRHLSNIFVKLNVPGRAAAVAYAIRQMLV